MPTTVTSTEKKDVERNVCKSESKYSIQIFFQSHEFVISDNASHLLIQAVFNDLVRDLNFCKAQVELLRSVF